MNHLLPLSPSHTTFRHTEEIPCLLQGKQNQSIAFSIRLLSHTPYYITALINLSLSTAAFALGHAFLAIRKPRVPPVAVALLDTLGPRRAAPQAPRHAPQNRHAWRAVVLEPVQYAVPALAAVRCAAQHRRAHDPHRDQQQNKQGCCGTGVLDFLLHLYHRESKGLFANGNNTHILFSFYMQRGDGSVNCEIHQN